MLRSASSKEDNYWISQASVTYRVGIRNTPGSVGCASYKQVYIPFSHAVFDI